MLQKFWVLSVHVALRKKQDQGVRVQQGEDSKGASLNHAHTRGFALGELASCFEGWAGEQCVLTWNYYSGHHVDITT